MAEATPSPVGLVLEPDQIRERVARDGRRDHARLRGPLADPGRGAQGVGACSWRISSGSIDLPVRVDFMAISSYGDGGRSGVVRILKDLSEPIEGEDVILVEDIIDTGLTVTYLLDEHARAQAAVARGLRAARQERPAHHRGADPLQGVRHPR